MDRSHIHADYTNRLHVKIPCSISNVLYLHWYGKCGLNGGEVRVAEIFKLNSRLTDSLIVYVYRQHTSGGGGGVSSNATDYSVCARSIQRRTLYQ